MFKRILFAMVFPGSAMLFVLSPEAGFAQEGVLKVQVADSVNGEALVGASVIVESAGVVAAKGLADAEGKLVFKNLLSGEYSVKAIYVGYSKSMVGSVLVKNNETTYLEIKLSSGQVMDDFVFTVYKKPLIDPNTSNKVTFTHDEIKVSPLSPMELIAQGTGAVQQKEGMSPSFHGARTTSNVIFIDGMRVIGSASLPRMGVQQISVTLGGVPAQFGDGTGGFIEIETRSGLVAPSR